MMFDIMEYSALNDLAGMNEIQIIVRRHTDLTFLLYQDDFDTLGWPLCTEIMYPNIAAAKSPKTL